MLQLSPSARRVLVLVHMVASLGWIGALLVFLAHAAVSVASRETQIVRAAAWAMELAAWMVILPLALASVLTGLAQALATPWGLTRHYWVLFKLVLTTLATSVLLLKLGPIESLSRSASLAAFSASDMLSLRASLLVHAVGGVVVLVAAAVLGFYKPAGVTWWAARRGLARSRNSSDQAERPPVWVRWSLAGTAILIVLLALMVFAGEHGPRMHSMR